MSASQRILVFGASSAICHALLKRYAAAGGHFFLVARDSQKLAAVGDDLEARGGSVDGSATYDFNDNGRHEEALGEAVAALGGIDLAIVAHGSLPDQEECETSLDAVEACMNDNFTSAAVIVQGCARVLDQQGMGTLAVLSSVAGDRGRKSNYVYGAAKSGMDTLLQGLRTRFFGTDISVVNIKPGLIASPMTAGMQQGALWSTPEAIAPSIERAIRRGRPICYVPGRWRLIMLVIRLLPTAVMARLPI